MNKSFTLIEILVVIVVIGVLSAFILVGMSSISSKANIAKGQAFINSMNNSLLISRVSQWKLDGNYNDSWSGKTATPVNSPTATSSCAQDSCYTFNGSSSQYAWIADDNTVFNFGSYMSAFVWVKGAAQADKYVFAQLDANTNWVWGIAVDSLGRLRALVASTGAVTPRRDYTATSGIPFDNTWHLVGFTFNNGVFKLYIDGLEASVSKAQDDAVTTIYNNSTINLTIGSYLGAGYFTGSIDDARLYNQPIPTSEIQENYYIGINKLYKNNGITLNEFNERIVELKSNISENE